MLTNYFKITLRNLFKSPAYFVISILGLSIGMASCILIVQFVYFELTFDSFHQDSKSIARIIVETNDGKLASTPVPVAPLLAAEFEEVVESVRFRESSGIIETVNKKVSNKTDDILMTGSSFLNVFSFPLLIGNAESLDKPGSIVLTEEMAKQYFNSTDILGQELNLYEDNFGLLKLTVTGVLKSLPKNSHLRMSALIALNSIENNNSFWAKFDNWGWNDFYTYVKLKPGTSIPERGLEDFLNKYVGEEDRINSNLKVDLQPIEEIHLTTELQNEYGHNRNATSVYFLLLVGIIILLMAVINYVNLVTAKGFERAKEVGVRKNLGASQSQLIGQFSFEAVLVNVMAFLLSITTVQLAMPALSSTVDGAFDQSLFSNPVVMLAALTPVLLGIVWSAIQPSILMAAFSMNDILKGKVSNYGKGLFYRKGSVVIQFVLSLGLMIVSFIIYKQVSYFQNKDLGINIDHVVVVERPRQNTIDLGDRALSFKNALEDYSHISAVSVSGSIPSSGFNWSTNSLARADKSNRGESEQSVSVTYIDNEYYEVYEPELLAGQAQYKGEDSSLKAIVNESALAPLMFDNAEEAVGKVVATSETSVEIIGVIKDYSHRSLKTNVEPALYLLDINPNYFSIRFNTSENVLEATQSVLAVIEKEYKVNFPDNLFQYSFVDDRFENQFKRESNFGWIMLLFTSLALFLAVLGLFSLSAYNLTQRTKEVGVRKVLGASTFSLLWRLSLGFVRLIAIAILVSIPLAYYLGDRWLQEFTNRIELSPEIFIIPVLTLIIITLSTTSFHIYKLAKTNPVDSLRYE